MSMEYENSDRPVSLAQLFLSFLRLGLTAFGGPTMVAYIGEMSVKKFQWLDQGVFKNGVALSQSIPGATAMQVAGYVGLKTRGIPGAIATFVGFGLPAFLFMLLLSWAYAMFGDIPRVASLFRGLQVIVVAIIANATYMFSKGTLRKYQDILIAITSAAALWSGISPFFVILGAALIGIMVFRVEKVPLASKYPDSNGDKSDCQFFILTATTVAAIACLFLANRKLFDLALLMMKIDLFAFGGGFASVPLMLQEVVNVRGWMDSKTFMDGIALGQVTPGPIVITTTFVGFLTNGITGAIVATAAIFIPSFILLVLGSHIFSRLQQSALFQRSLKGILASFVGLLLFVTVKFAFAVPWNMVKVIIVAGAMAGLLKKIDILYIVLAGACVSMLLL